MGNLNTPRAVLKIAYKHISPCADVSYLFDNVIIIRYVIINVI